MFVKTKKRLKLPVTILFKLGVRPNHITFLGLIIAIIALFQEFWTGITLFIISFILDLVDGNLARKHKLSSKFGGVLDSVVDKIIEILFIYFLAVKFSIQTIGMISIGLSIMISYIKHRSGLSLHSIFDRAERVLFLFITIIFFNTQITNGFIIYNTLCVLAIIQLMIKVRRRL